MVMTSWPRLVMRTKTGTTLAAATQTTKQAAKFLVDQPETGGYVERISDPKDQRWQRTS